MIVTHFNKDDILRRDGSLIYLNKTSQVACYVCNKWYTHISTGEDTSASSCNGIHIAHIVEDGDSRYIIPDDHHNCHAIYKVAPIVD